MDPSKEDAQSSLLAQNCDKNEKKELTVVSSDEQSENEREKQKSVRIFVDRDPLNQVEFHDKYEFVPKRNVIPFVGNHLHHPQNEDPDSKENCCSFTSQKIHSYLERIHHIQFLGILLQIVPILQWLPKYRWKQDFANDLMAGFTVAVMHVPQGLAYAMLAQIDAISGIYTAFFPVIVYILLGTSRHVSMGTFAVISILVSKPVIEHCSSEPTENFTSVQTIFASSLSNQTMSDHEIDCQMKVTVAVTFLAGIIQLIMGFMKLGLLSSLLSDSLMSGFTTGSAIHVLTSQLPHLFGFRIPKYTGPGRLIKCYSAIFEKMSTSNYVAIGMSLACLFILLVYEFKIKVRVGKMCRFPIPVQFSLVVLATLVAWSLKLNEKYGLRVVGKVPTGMPTPYIPFLDTDLLHLVFFDAFGIAIISYVISLSISRILASKHRYQVDANQELAAQGAANIFGSFFQSLPMAGSLSRTMVQEASGGRTLMASAVSVILLLFVILFFGPLFYHLPRATLSAIILVSLMGIFMQFRDLIRYAKRSHSEAFVWVATFLFTILLDVDLGLLAGIIVSLLFLISWGYFPKIEVIGRTSHKDLFLQADSFQKGAYFGKTIAVRISGNLNMANATSLSNRIEAVLNQEFQDQSWTDGKCKNLVLEISSVTHVDAAACQGLLGVNRHFKNIGLKLIFAGTRAEVWNRFGSCSLFEEICEERFYPTLQDALASLSA